MSWRLVTAAALIALSAVSLFAPSEFFERYFSHSSTACPLGYGSSGGGPPDLGAWTGSAGTLYYNARVWTGAVDQRRLEEAFVVGSNGRFKYVGSRAGAARAAGPHATAVDLVGQHVLPGLIDSHVHVINGGLSLVGCDLRGATSKDELIRLVAEAAAKLPAGDWLVCYGWSEPALGGGPLAADWVDGATPATPALLLRSDGHTALANSAALRAAGVDAATPDPRGGVIGRDASGHPTGLLRHSAMQLVASVAPPPSLAARRQALAAATALALSRGITAVHDMGRLAYVDGEEAAWEDLEQVYLPAANTRELGLRVYAFVPLPTWRRMAERVRHVGTEHPGGRLKWGGLKEFADGSLGGRTALMHEPYADDPGTAGVRGIELPELESMVAQADRAGLQVAVHAIGDLAVDDVLSLLERVQEARNASGGATAAHPIPHRVEHVQHVSGPAVGRRMAALGAAATPNPLHLLDDERLLLPRLGPERAGPERAYAWHRLTQAGVTVALASDWPIAPLDALHSMYIAVHREAPPNRSSGGFSSWWARKRWHPAGLTAWQAVAAATAAGADAAGWSHEIGRIREGLRADFVVLSASPLEGGEVRQTYLDGRCAYGCPPQEGAAAAGERVEL